MKNKLPHEVWVDREALIRPALSSYVSNKNEIEDGVRMYPADRVDREKRLMWLWFIVAQILFRVLMNWMGI
nr:hypothetical protein CKG001_10450 [Bdellovibrio sp. CKG001]